MRTFEPCRHGIVAAIALLVVGGATLLDVQAAYPERPLRMVVAASGTGSDITARIIAPRLSERWGQTVVVENRAGASGTIAAASAAKAASDGYTMLMADTTQLATAPKLYAGLPYHPVNDFSPVTLILKVPLVLTTHPSFPATSLRDLINLAKQRPGTISYSSASNGSPGHLTCALLSLLAGIDVVHVPYKGGGGALVAVLGRETQFTSTTTMVAAPHIKGARLRALAVATKNRVSVLPDVPTGAEAGVPGLESAAWFGVVARTSVQIIEKLNRDIAEVVRESAVQSALLAQGGEIATGAPREFGDWIRSETTKWGKVIQAVGAKAN
jgi:tripartite-type tricarboxylate transporter receptor subunit TctC